MHGRRALGCALIASAWLLGGCNCNSQPAQPDSPGPADAPVDAAADAPVDAAADAPVDAPDDAPAPDALVDATPDATPDAHPDGHPMGCEANTELIADIAPYRVSGMVTDGTHLITEERTTNPDGTVLDSRIVVRDLFASDGTTIRDGVDGHFLSAYGTTVYWSEPTAGSIYRWQSGGAPELLVSGLTSLSTVVANSTDLFWLEHDSMSDRIQRRTIAAGGAITTVAPDLYAPALYADETTLYVGEWYSGAHLWAYPLDGTPGTILWSPSPGIFPVGITEDDGFLYWTDFQRAVWRRDLATGTNTLIAHRMPALTRPTGVAVRGVFVFVVDEGPPWGLYRARKDAVDGTLIMVSPDAIGADDGPVVISTYVHWAAYDKLYRCH